MSSMVVLPPATSFNLPALFSNVESPYASFMKLQAPRYLYHVGDSLISLAISEIIKNKSDSTEFTFEKLLEGKEFKFELNQIEKSDMRMVDPSSFFLQTRYPEEDWTTSSLRIGVQALIYHGASVVEDLMKNGSTFEKNIVELIDFALPSPDTTQDGS